MFFLCFIVVTLTFYVLLKFVYKIKNKRSTLTKPLLIVTLQDTQLIMIDCFELEKYSQTPLTLGCQ